MGKTYLGLDIGTDSIGWAVTDEKYKLKKFHGEPMWGSVLFEAANHKAERRASRIARRLLNRRKQRVQLLQELFAEEINKVDSNFYKRLRESALYREDKNSRYSLFEDEYFTDREYHKRYPTIHHLIVDLMNSKEPHDIRLVYLACAWLVAHRGHFLSEVSRDNISAVLDFQTVYRDLTEYIVGLSDSYSIPWKEEDSEALRKVLPMSLTPTIKYKELKALLFPDGKLPKDIPEEQFPISCEIMLKALCGSKIAAKDLFNSSAYEDIESFSLSSDDETIAGIIAELGDDGELVIRLKAIYDWSVLIDVLNGNSVSSAKDRENEMSISAAKVKIYQQHAKDLKILKYLVRKYLPSKYNEIFRSEKEGSYTAYAKHQKNEKRIPKKWASKTVFSEYLKSILKNLSVEKEDELMYADMMERLNTNTFLPKQRDTDNRVIPYQLYWYELNMILKNARSYLPFLMDKDENGSTVSEKILSVLSFKIPYYVGPLNSNSEHAWIVKKGSGRIYPWNFEQVVDLDKSEDEFIRRMVNGCSYLADGKCLPKESLLYRKYMVLNEINNIKINGIKISVQLKQSIYNDLFCSYRKVTRKRIEDYLLSNGHIEKREELSGIDIKINANLSSYHDFKLLLKEGKLSEEDVERIIERRTYSEDKPRYIKWLKDKYPILSEDDIRYLAKLRYKEFGRLSKDFLNQLEGEDDQGNKLTIMSALWNTNNNLMELLSNSFTFGKVIEDHNTEYYSEHPSSVEKRLDDMYISNAVKRPVLRTLEVMKEVTKALGKTPDKVFIEMARGASQDQKHKRTRTRKQQLIEYYKNIDTEDVRLLRKELEDMGDMADNRLQSDQLYLYFMQLGRSMYSGERIDIKRLGSKLYDIDHIYPQRMVKDDSLLNNKVLCLSEENGSIKKDRYPVPAEWRKKQKFFWKMLKDKHLITEEKYKRLMRGAEFSDDEKLGFINRQLTETSQSSKAVASLLKEFYPGIEIIYVKARLTSEFRSEFKMFKSRSFNDLHHAKDAYLNIVTGNVYNTRFSKKWFSLREDYSLNTKAIFGKRLWYDPNGDMVWGGYPMLGAIRETVEKNNAHLTQYAFCRHGKYFDQNPVKKGADLIPRKAGLSTEKYGGYNKTTASFFMLVKYKAGKKQDIVVLPIELLFVDQCMKNHDYADQYVKEQIEKIYNVKVDKIEFPLGDRKLKINTIFAIDGFRFALSSKENRGKNIIASPMMAFSGNGSWQNYLHHIDSFSSKHKENNNIVYDEKHDKVRKDKNIELYDMYINKLKSSVYAKRPRNPLKILEDGRETFCKLEIVEQIEIIQSIHQVFGRASGGVNLLGIGGKKSSGKTSLSAALSNLGKNYKEVYIIDPSVTGLWEKRSENLLDML